MTGGEIIRHDAGGWISGPSVSAEPVAAQDVGTGDRILLDDGRTAEVTDVSTGDYYFAQGRGPGVALGWKAGSTTSGMMLRRGSDVLQRVTSQPRPLPRQPGPAGAGHYRQPVRHGIMRSDP